MDLTDPSLSWTSSLDGPVLSVLAEYDRPLSVSEIAEKSARGTEIGIRKVIHRLVEQGLVVGVSIGKRSGYHLNRDHVAAEGIVHLTGLRRALWTRMGENVSHWRVKPSLVRVFGSAARGDGNESSDIDLLVVRPSTLHEVEIERQREREKGSAAALDAFMKQLSRWMTATVSEAQVSRLEQDLADLSEKVRSWSGNATQSLLRSTAEWARESRTGLPAARAIMEQGITIFEATPVGYTRFGGQDLA